MTNAVFYSVSPYGTGNLETGYGNIAVTSGVATLSVEQTGNIGVGVSILYALSRCWIAPNRIAFTSGGTTELLTGTKIAGGTSGATGIVRAIEVNSGTWGAGTAAGWIYFESTTGTWGSSEQINRTKPTSSTNIATTNGSLEGNIGNGNTEFVVKTATGGTPSDQTATAVTSINHEWASLADFESYFTNSSHINNTSLVTADVVAYACCYYDHDDQTADTTMTVVDFGTTGTDNYLQIYTPVGEAESINSQRHNGKWDTEKYKLDDIDVTSGAALRNTEQYVVIKGIQMSFVPLQGTLFAHGIRGEASSATGRFDVSHCIVKTTGSNTGSYIGGIHSKIVTGANIYNNVIYNILGGNVFNAGIVLESGTANVYNNTVHSCTGTHGFGLYEHGGTMTVKNCAVFNNTDDYYECTVTYSASDDTQTGTGNIDWANEATDWNNVFVGYSSSPPDVHLNNFTGTGKIIDMGAADPGSGLFWRDIDGNERGASWDIGAFEYVSAGPSVSIPVIMHHLRQQGIS